MPSPAQRELANWIAESESGLALTGAGMSTESGIPDFRSPGGVWSRYRTVYYDEFMASAAARHEYWRQKVEAHSGFQAAAPNAGHLTLARWEAAGRLDAVVTQNIDGLHQDAGSRRVLELHGTAREAACQQCGIRRPIQPLVDYFLEHDSPPDCERCGGYMKHATVSFGQALPEDVLREATELARACDVLLAIGSSLVVTPAAELPLIAKRAGARLAIINRDPTPLDDTADVVVQAEIGATLAAVDAELNA